jgi:hypothetical protein
MTSKFQTELIAKLSPAPAQVRDDLITWRPFPKDPIIRYVRFLGERGAGINVKGPEHEADVIDFLSTIEEADLDAVTPEAPLGLRELKSRRVARFEVCVVVHPSVANRSLTKDVTFMAPLTFLVFPAYKCEFTKNDDVEDAKYRLNKTVNWSDWSRDPAPVVAMRYKLSSGVKSTGGKALMLFKPGEAERTLTHLGKEGGFMEVENFERQVTTIRQEGGNFSVELGKDTHAIKPERVAPWFQAFLRDGAEASLRKLREA